LIWQDRSPEFQSVVVIELVVLGCVVAAVLTHPLPAYARTVLSALMICAGSLMAVEQVLDLVLPRKQYVLLGPTIVVVAFVAYALLTPVHTFIGRVLLAAACGAIPIVLYEKLRTSSSGTSASPKSKQRLIFAGCILIVLGTVVALDPVSKV